jgi:MYXO-CTERM domain-containing protein
VEGTLVEEGGARGGRASLPVETPRLEAALEPLPEGVSLVARCGRGASGTLTQTFPAGACQTSTVTWTQVGGPGLDLQPLSERSVELATQSTELMDLVGESVVLQATATAGPGNVAAREHVVPITVEPFVEVRRRTETPVASDTGLVGISVELTNTQACGVSGVQFTERLEGMTYMPGSARFNGVPVEDEWAEGVLTVRGLALEADSSGVLTYVVRPHLLGERFMAGSAFLRGVPISRDGGSGVPVSGCGCASASPGLALLALGALAGAVRRRRRGGVTGRS